MAPEDDRAAWALYLGLMAAGLALFVWLVSGCATSHDSSVCSFACETAVSCEGDAVVLRACEVQERDYRNVFCDARAATLETLDAACVRSCRARGACALGDGPETTRVTVCNCQEGP